MAIDEVSIQQYLDGITCINTTLGRLDTLRLHLKEKNDNFSLLVVNAIMEDLAKVCGVENKVININNMESDKQENKIIKPTQDDKMYKDISNIAPKEPTIIEIIQDDNYVYPTEIDKNNIAKATLKAEKTKNKLNKKEKIINESKGVEIDNKTGNLTYKFVNSNTLNFMTYNKSTKDLIMCFLQNGRTYLYKTVPMYIFDNLHITDESGASAGSYFQQNVAKKWGKGTYKEITDTILIG